MDSNHKGPNFAHPTTKDVRRTGCDGLSLRAKNSTLLVAQARQHLQEVKADAGASHFSIISKVQDSPYILNGQF